jgi:hypothetical protein
MIEPADHSDLLRPFIAAGAAAGEKIFAVIEVPITKRVLPAAIPPNALNKRPASTPMPWLIRDFLEYCDLVGVMLVFST